MEGTCIDIKNRIFIRVQKRLIRIAQPSDEEVLNLIEDCILCEPEVRQLSKSELYRIRHELFNRIRRLDVLQDFLDDNYVT